MNTFIKYWLILVILFSVRYAYSGDPMAPPGIEPVKPIEEIKKEVKIEPEFLLFNILISEDRRVAVINNQIVKVGDVIKDAKVISISSKSVSLSRNGNTFFLVFDRSLVERQKE